MGRLRIIAAEYKYKELHRDLKEQFIKGLNHDGVMQEIIWNLISMVDTSLVISEQVLAKARRVEAQRTKTTMPYREAKFFLWNKVTENRAK